MIVAGVEPRAIIEPQGVAELAAGVAALYANDTPFAFAGGGTELELGNVPRSIDTLVKTTACNAVIEYAPQDQTITVEAGMTLAAVGAVLAHERQFLAIDAPEPERTTIGGAIATNLYGGRRLRYGSIKDTIVGVEIVRPDGTRARGGGKVVKNVAGFDMPKLMVGSLGTLGAIAGATFRVHPLPERCAALIYADLSIEQLMRVANELIGAALVPSAVTAFGAQDGSGYVCRVSFEGFARGVEQQVEAAHAIASSLSLRARTDENEDAPGTPFYDCERAVRRAAPWRLTLSTRPTALARFLSAAPFPAGARHVVYPLLGTAFIAADTLDAATVARWRAQLDGGSLIVNALPQRARATVDVWGEPAPGALTIMRRLKNNFDPKGLCNAGRFVGGL
jgi:glycolate oxidase FAD binding subunit